MSSRGRTGPGRRLIRNPLGLSVRHLVRPIAALTVAFAFGTSVGVRAQEVSDLHARLSRTFSNSAVRGATWGVMVLSLDSGDTLFAIEPGSPLAPASNLKLLTTAAALGLLGPDYRFRTYLLTNGDVVDGVVDGDLVLYGTGDPGISSRFYSSKDEVFQRLVDQLLDLGIHTVTGDLVGDASFMPGPLRPEGWDSHDLNDHFTGAVSALSYNENVVSFRVVPGAVGRQPDVYTVPENAGLDIVNHAETVLERARPRLAILRDNPLDPVRVEGRLLRSARDVWRQMTVPVPAHYAVSVFRAALEERGIALQGEVRVVESPGESIVGHLSAPAVRRRGARVLARHVSDPLRGYLAVINKESNNLFAELVFREIGRVAEGVGSPEASARAVRSELTRIGVDMHGVVQLDGSGLSAGNRVSASTFVSVIDRMAESRLWAEYWASLPEAGRRRELGRMYGTAAAGNLRAKTGTIEGVSALSGLVRSGDGERLAFSILVNGAASSTRAKSVENRVGALLASFHRGAEGALPVRMAAAGRSFPEARMNEAPGRHQVTYGESLSVIASRYGVSLGELIRANPRVEPNSIMAGQWIEIPQSGGSE